MRPASVDPKAFNRSAKETADSPGTTQHKPAKSPRDRVLAPQRERILQKHVAGKSIKLTSKEENRNRETVSKIVHGPEMQDLLSEMRKNLFSLVGDAINALGHNLKRANDGRLALQFLVNLRVLPLPDEFLIGASDPEAGQKYWLMRLVEQTIERARAFERTDSQLDEAFEKVGAKINYQTGKIGPLEKKTPTRGHL